MITKDFWVLLAMVMLLCQLVSIYWVWHESQEQVSELVKLALNPEHSLRELESEKRETISALLFPNLLMTLLALGLVSLVVKGRHPLSGKVNRPVIRARRAGMVGRPSP